MFAILYAVFSIKLSVFATFSV